MAMTAGRWRNSGFTLIEVLSATVLMTVGLVGLGLVFVSSQRSHEMSIEEAVVSHAIRRTVEQMRGENFADIATLYQGYQFTLDAINGFGTVTIIVDETATVPELGLPRDLDGTASMIPSFAAADSTAIDVTSSYVLLPVRIDVTWPAAFGNQTRTLYTFLSEGG